MTEEIQKDYYTIDEFANKLRVHPQTIRRGIKSGRIQAAKISGRCYRISKDEIGRINEFDLKKMLEAMAEKIITRREEERGN
jgi:excisionase family DNA binding protein